MKASLSLLVAALLLASCGSGSDSGEDAPALAGGTIKRVGMLEQAVSEARGAYVEGVGALLTGGDYGVGGTSAIQAFDPVTGSARVVGQMHEPRFVHSLNVTTSGRVIVAGGFNRVGRFLDSVEEVDPKSGVTKVLHPLCEERDNQHAVALPDGRVLFIGGDSDGAGYIAGLEIYDPSGAASDCSLSLLQGRVHEAVADVGSGVVYVFGGLAAEEDGSVRYLTSIERVDTVRGVVESAGQMQFARKQFRATRLQDGRILLTGGFSDGGPIAEAEIFDPETGVSTVVGPMLDARAGHSATRLSDGSVLVAGGIGVDGALVSTEIFAPGSGAFRAGPEMSTVRALHTALLLPDGSVLLLGGYQGAASYTAAIGRFEGGG
jgi:hypothetical protein